MKLNKKVFAGALALAMGIAAIAPSYATTGKGIIDKEYYEAEEIFIKEFEEKVALEKAVDEAKAKVAEAKKAFEAQQEVVKGLKDEKKVLEDRVAKLLEDKKVNEDKKASMEAEKDNLGESAKEDAERQIRGLERTNKVIDDEVETIREAKIPAVDAKIADANDVLEDRSRELSEASRILRNAEEALKADKGYDEAKLAFILAGGSKDIIDRAEEKKVYERSHGVDEPAEKEDDKKEDKDYTAAIRAALQKNKDMVTGLEWAAKMMPDVVKKYQAEYDKVMADSKKAVKAAEDYLAGKEVAFELISTAYAAEEETEGTDEEAEKILKDLEDNTKAGEELAKKLNEEVKNEEEETEEETPAENDDDKKEDDKKDEEKPAEKEDDKKEDKKPEVKEKKDVKPSKNVKTGVAGIAGVGAVLAAASAAYVASKRD